MRLDEVFRHRVESWSFRAGHLAVALLLGAAGCAPAVTGSTAGTVPLAAPGVPAGAPDPDPRVGLAAGLWDAGEATWNLRVLSTTPPPREFLGSSNSDLAFFGDYAIQGNYNGFQIWDISDPARPELVTGYVCPASQSDVSVYENLLFVSGEGYEGRLDCGTQGVRGAVSADRLRGIRIFDISDVRNPEYVGNVQTCRGSHTHTVLEHPGDTEHVYVYVSGSAPVRPEAELPGCSGRPPSEDPNSALFRIEVIRVPLANPEQAAIVSSPRIFDDLAAPPRHGLTPVEREAIEQAQARGEFILEVMGETIPVPIQVSSMMLDSIMRVRGGTGTPTAEDSATLRRDLTAMIEESIADQIGGGPTQCHDITVYPAIGLAGGACEGYGLLLDIRDPIDPKRIAAVADSNFAYWHSATFNNDGSAILFTDEWGGGGGARCRATDPIEWGANAIYSIEGGELRFRSYYKLPAPQTDQENCVAHNGSLIPIPGRDVKVQAWYQGGVSVFDWTDPANPFEIAFHDRGPVHPTRMESAGSWSAYWYNGVIVSSEIARGLDIFELEPSEFISRNELDAARSVRLEYLNPQGQPRFEWPASIALAGAYLDQLERSGGLSVERIGNARQRLAAAGSAAGVDRVEMLIGLAAELQGEAARSTDGPKLELLVDTLRELASETATD
jgi:hypothetical protein